MALSPSPTTIYYSVATRPRCPLRALTTVLLLLVVLEVVRNMYHDLTDEA